MTNTTHLINLLDEAATSAADELDAWTDAANRQDSRLLIAIAQSKKDWQRGAINHLRDKLKAILEHADFDRV